jgi:hypothetical protein
MNMLNLKSTDETTQLCHTKISNEFDSPSASEFVIFADEEKNNLFFYDLYDLYMNQFEIIMFLSMKYHSFLSDGTFSKF